MVRYVWYVWYGMAWHGMAWYGMDGMDGMYVCMYVCMHAWAGSLPPPATKNGFTSKPKIASSIIQQCGTLQQNFICHFKQKQWSSPKSFTIKKFQLEVVGC